MADQQNKFIDESGVIQHVFTEVLDGTGGVVKNKAGYPKKGFMFIPGIDARPCTKESIAEFPSSVAAANYTRLKIIHYFIYP